MEIRRDPGTVFRNSGMSVLAISAAVLFGLIFIGVALSAVKQGHNLVAVAVCSVLVWFLWIMGWWSKVVVDQTGVTVDNVLLRHVKPWQHLSGISADNGLTFELADGSQLGSICYGASLAGVVTRYRSLHRVRDQILAACDRYRDGSTAAGHPHAHQKRRQIVVTWWPLAAMLVPYETLAIAIDLARHTHPVTRPGHRGPGGLGTGAEHSPRHTAR